MTENEALNFALAQGIIDINTIQVQIEMYERKKYLDMHKNSIWQGANGKWYTELPGDKNHRRRLLKKSKLEDIHEEIYNFYKTRDEHPTFEAVFNKWLNNKLNWGEISKGTFDRYQTEFKRSFEGTDLPGKRIDMITEDYLEEFIKNRIKEKNLTAKAYGNLKTIIIGTFKEAKKKKYTDLSISSFFGDLQLSRKAFTTTEKKKQVFTDAEARKIIEYLHKNPSVENYGILLTFYTGIREGELAGLKYSDIEGDYLHIRRQEISYKAEDGSRVHEVVEYTKTEAGDRFVVLTDEAKDVLKRLRRLNPFGEYMMQLGNRKFYASTFNNRLYKACVICGIEPMSMHKIRKTYGTRLIDGGATDSTIQEQMGHSDITTTRKYYYFSNKDKQEKVEEVKRAINYG